MYYPEHYLDEDEKIRSLVRSHPIPSGADSIVAEFPEVLFCYGQFCAELLSRIPTSAKPSSSADTPRCHAAC